MEKSETRNQKPENKELENLYTLQKKHPQSKAIADKIAQLKADTPHSLRKATQHRLKRLAMKDFWNNKKPENVITEGERRNREWNNKQQRERKRINTIAEYQRRLQDPKYKSLQNQQWLRNKIAILENKRNPPKLKNAKHLSTINYKQRESVGEKLIKEYIKRLHDPKYKSPQNQQWLRNKIEETKRNKNLWKSPRWSQPREKTYLVGTDHKGSYATNEQHFIHGKKSKDNNGNFWFSGNIDRNSYGNSGEKIITRGKNKIWENGKWKFSAGGSASFIPNKEIATGKYKYRYEYIKTPGSNHIIGVRGFKIPETQTMPVIIPAIQGSVRYNLNKNLIISLEGAYTPSASIKGMQTPEIYQGQLGISYEW